LQLSIRAQFAHRHRRRWLRSRHQRQSDEVILIHRSTPWACCRHRNGARQDRLARQCYWPPRMDMGSLDDLREGWRGMGGRQVFRRYTSHTQKKPRSDGRGQVYQDLRGMRWQIEVLEWLSSSPASACGYSVMIRPTLLQVWRLLPAGSMNSACRALQQAPVGSVLWPAICGRGRQWALRNPDCRTQMLPTAIISFRVDATGFP
jgi:hypothetical protein